MSQPYCFDGQYLSIEEEDLVNLAIKDLDNFISRSVQNINRAMIFPAIDARRRYILHKTVEQFYPQLCTFSVGEDENRRLIIAFVERIENNTSPMKSKPKLPKSRSSWGYRAPPTKKPRIDSKLNKTKEEPQCSTNAAQTSDSNIQTQLSIDVNHQSALQDQKSPDELDYERQAERMALQLFDDSSNDSPIKPRWRSQRNTATTDVSQTSNDSHFDFSERKALRNKKVFDILPTTFAPAPPSIDASVYANSDRVSNVRQLQKYDDRLLDFEILSADEHKKENFDQADLEEQPKLKSNVEESLDSSIIDNLPMSLEEFDQAESMRSARRLSNRTDESIHMPSTSYVTSRSSSSMRQHSPPLDDDDREVAEINESYEKEQQNIQSLNSDKVKQAFMSGSNHSSNSNIMQGFYGPIGQSSANTDVSWNDWESEVIAVDNPNEDSEMIDWAKLLEEHQLHPAALEDITSALGKVHLELERPTFDYTQTVFRPVSAEIANNQSETPQHVLEAFGYTGVDSINDLLRDVLSGNQRYLYTYKAVDDSHALVCFDSAESAKEALQKNDCDLALKFRPICFASPQTREQLLKTPGHMINIITWVEFRRPYRQRPITNVNLIRRTIESHLGKRSMTSQDIAMARPTNTYRVTQPLDNIIGK